MLPIPGPTRPAKEDACRRRAAEVEMVNAFW
jgi:hypothetical protein